MLVAIVQALAVFREEPFEETVEHLMAAQAAFAAAVAQLRPEEEEAGTVPPE